MNELISEKDSVPKGWIKTTMDSVAVIILGQSSPSSTYNQEKKGLPFFQGKTNFGVMYPAVRNWCSDPKKSAEKNDILISVRVPVGPTNISKEKCCIGRGLAAIRPLSGVNYLWIFYHLRLLKNNIAMKGTGTTFQAISGTQLKSIILSIPPLNEQKRIVSKIESIFAQIDAIKEQFEMLAPQAGSNVGILDEMRNSVLRHAFEGRLVPQNLKDESSEILLKQIHKGSEKELVFEKNDSLPKGWIKVVLKNLVENIQKINPRETSDKMYYYCDIDSINNSKLKITTPKQVIGSEAPSRARQLIKKHDILFSTVRTYLKNIAIVPDNLDGQLASTGFCVIRPTINHKFVFYYVQSKSFLDVLNNIQRGTSYPAVRNNDVLSTLIPLPPLNEQKRIVSKIESIFGNIDSIEKQVNAAIRSLNTLKQSVLKLAFEGKLVPQDPNDEPASVLLEKIKLQKK